MREPRDNWLPRLLAAALVPSTSETTSPTDGLLTTLRRTGAGFGALYGRRLCGVPYTGVVYLSCLTYYGKLNFYAVKTNSTYTESRTTQLLQLLPTARLSGESLQQHERKKSSSKKQNNLLLLNCASPHSCVFSFRSVLPFIGGSSVQTP